MSSLSYRDRNRIYGYRSQPASNRSSLHLSGSSSGYDSYKSGFHVSGSSGLSSGSDSYKRSYLSGSSGLSASDSYKSGLNEEITVFDRQFKRLIERTEKFTNRVEKLHNTSNYLTRGYAGLDTSLTSLSSVSRLRNTRDIIGGSYGNLKSNNFEIEEYCSTEEEWKKLLDARTLLEKACELVRRGIRHPKPTFVYSPDSPSPQPYDAPYGTKLIPNPRSPRDKEGKRIRDMGSEIKDHLNDDVSKINGYVDNDVSETVTNDVSETNGHVANDVSETNGHVTNDVSETNGHVDDHMTDVESSITNTSTKQNPDVTREVNGNVEDDNDHRSPVKPQSPTPVKPQSPTRVKPQSPRTRRRKCREMGRPGRPLRKKSKSLTALTDLMEMDEMSDDEDFFPRRDDVLVERPNIRTRLARRRRNEELPELKPININKVKIFLTAKTKVENEDITPHTTIVNETETKVKESETNRNENETNSSKDSETKRNENETNSTKDTENGHDEPMPLTENRNVESHVSDKKETDMSIDETQNEKINNDISRDTVDERLTEEAPSPVAMETSCVVDMVNDQLKTTSPPTSPTLPTDASSPLLPISSHDTLIERPNIRSRLARNREEMPHSELKPVKMNEVNTTQTGRIHETLVPSQMPIASCPYVSEVNNQPTPSAQSPEKSPDSTATTFSSEKIFSASTSSGEEKEEKCTESKRSSLFRTLKNAASRNKKNEEKPESLKRSDSESSESSAQDKNENRFENTRFGRRKSSFHEYNSEKRVPLKERLKNQREEKAEETTTIGDVGRDSLRSRFLRRFGLGTDERMMDIKEANTRKTRKKSDDFSFYKILKKNDVKENDEKKNEDVKSGDALHRESYVEEEEIQHEHVEDEDVEVHVKSERKEEVMEEVTEEVIIVSLIIDRKLPEDFFKLLQQQQVSEDEVQAVGITSEQPTLSVDDFFEKMESEPLHTQLTSLSTSTSSYTSLPQHASSELVQSTSSEISARDHIILRATSLEELCKSDDVFMRTTSERSTEVSSENANRSTWHMIEEANNKLYQGLLNLTKFVSRSVGEVEQSLPGRTDHVQCEEKPGTIDKLQTSNANTQTAELQPSMKEKVEVAAEQLPQNVELNNSEAMRTRYHVTSQTKEYSDDAPRVPHDIIDTIYETTKDVNKMLSNCKSIDEINKEIERPHQATTDNDEKHNTGVSNDNTDVMNDESTSTKKRSSYLQKRSSHMNLFSNDSTVSKEKTSICNETNKLNATRREASIEYFVLNEIIERVVKNVPTPPSRKEEDMKKEIVENNITKKDEEQSKYKNGQLHDDQNNANTNVPPPSNNEVNNPTHNADASRPNLSLNTNTKPFSLPSTKSEEDKDHPSKKKSSSSTNPTKHQMLAGGIKSQQSVEVLSLDQIRNRLGQLRSSSATSSLTNINELPDEKPKVVIKSLDDIKNRLNQIRARKRQLNMGALTKNKWMSMDDSLASVNEVTSPRGELSKAVDDTNVAFSPPPPTSNKNFDVPLDIRNELPKLITEKQGEEEFAVVEGESKDHLLVADVKQCLSQLLTVIERKDAEERAREQPVLLSPPSANLSRSKSLVELRRQRLEKGSSSSDASLSPVEQNFPMKLDDDWKGTEPISCDNSRSDIQNNTQKTNSQRKTTVETSDVRKRDEEDKLMTMTRNRYIQRACK